MLRVATNGTVGTVKRVVNTVPYRGHNEVESWKRDILEGRKHQRSSEYPANEGPDPSNNTDEKSWPKATKGLLGSGRS